MPDEVQERIETLESYLKSDALSFEGRLWAWREIWDMKIATYGNR